MRLLQRAAAAKGAEVLRAALLSALQCRGGEADREGAGAACRDASRGLTRGTAAKLLRSAGLRSAKVIGGESLGLASDETLARKAADIAPIRKRWKVAEADREKGLELSNNEIRKLLLDYFYDRNKNATSIMGKRGSAIRISDVKSELKSLHGLTLQPSELACCNERRSDAANKVRRRGAFGRQEQNK